MNDNHSVANFSCTQSNNLKTPKIAFCLTRQQHVWCAAKSKWNWEFHLKSFHHSTLRYHREIFMRKTIQPIPITSPLPAPSHLPPIRRNLVCAAAKLAWHTHTIWCDVASLTVCHRLRRRRHWLKFGGKIQRHNELRVRKICRSIRIPRCQTHVHRTCTQTHTCQESKLNWNQWIMVSKNFVQQSFSELCAVPFVNHSKSEQKTSTMNSIRPTPWEREKEQHKKCHVIRCSYIWNGREAEIKSHVCISFYSLLYSMPPTNSKTRTQSTKRNK